MPTFKNVVGRQIALGKRDKRNTYGLGTWWKVSISLSHVIGILDWVLLVSCTQ